MTDESLDTGDGFLDGVLFAASAIVCFGAAVVGCQVLNHLLRDKDRESAGDRDR